jgi:regulator of sirC expression with transglutaminase-like and TPR domain
MRPDVSTYPNTCNAEAYFRFVDSLPRLHMTASLVDAAIAVSMHALEDVDPGLVHHELAMLAQRVTKRIRNRTEAAVLAHLHDVLFEEEKFTGNSQHSCFALHSYLPAVLAHKKGLPILLSLLYKAVGERVGLTIQGINAPGHFLVRVQTQEGPAIVDPFCGGALLTREEAFRRIQRATGEAVPQDDRLLATASNVRWIARILANLINHFGSDNRRDDLAAMLELRQALEEYRS